MCKDIKHPRYDLLSENPPPHKLRCALLCLGLTVFFVAATATTAAICKQTCTYHSNRCIKMFVDFDNEDNCWIGVDIAQKIFSCDGLAFLKHLVSKNKIITEYGKSVKRNLLECVDDVKYNNINEC